jgi:polyisoprenoid-binding protein YceI
MKTSLFRRQSSAIASFLIVWFCGMTSAWMTSARAATPWTTLAPESSSVSFTYQQMGVQVPGRFRNFSAQVNWDPAAPANASIAIDIDLNSIDAGSGEADQEVVGKTWLNIKGFPTARFVATQVKSLAPGKFEVTGKLTIKGQTRDIAFPVTLSETPTQATFEGALTIRRGDFTIGEGAWSKFDVVANDVIVKFKMVARGRKS